MDLPKTVGLLWCFFGIPIFSNFWRVDSIKQGILVFLHLENVLHVFRNVIISWVIIIGLFCIGIGSVLHFPLSLWL